MQSHLTILVLFLKFLIVYVVTSAPWGLPLPCVGGASPTGELNFHHCTACPSTCRRRAGPPHARVSASRAAPCRFPFALSKAVDTVALRLAVATGWRAPPNRGAPIQPGSFDAGEDAVRFVWQCGCEQPHSAANTQTNFVFLYC